MAQRKILLIGWDAADWKVIRPLMEQGKMPNVRRLVENGASGQIATLHPPLSPMLWTSIATGKRPFKHGIHGFSEPTPDGRGVQPVSNLSRKSKALWNILHQNDLRSVVIGWWPSHPAEPINGVMVSDHYHRARCPLDQGWPLLENAVYPPEMADTLAGLRVHPDQLTPEMVEPFIPLAREIDQDEDKRLALFLRTIAECMSVHSAALWLIEHQPWDFFAVYYDAIDHFCHGFMRYHPPRQSWIGDRDFELYRNVVPMAYQFHDQMLGTLLKNAGKDITVILLSDHGFHPDHQRPASIPDIPAGPAIEHRDFGIVALKGPGIKEDELLNGSSVLDVAPTILALYGLPVGEDMDGKVLSHGFVKTPKIEYIPSWEEVLGPDGRHPPHTRLDSLAVYEALEQMIALGYIERPDEQSDIAVQKTIRELRYNLGEAYQDGDRHIEAHEIFGQLYAIDPDERIAVRLFVSCQALGMHDEMRRIVDDLEGRRRALFEEAKTKIELALERTVVDSDPESLLNFARYQPSLVYYLEAQLLTVEKRYPEALTALERMTEAYPGRPSLLLQTADLYLHLDRWDDAKEVYEKALAIDPDRTDAYLGLSRMDLRRRKYSAAAHSALDALQRIDHNPLAHFLLGCSLTGMKEYGRAAESFRAAISFNPNYPEAHVRLAGLLSRHLSDPESAREHRRLARRMRRRPKRSVLPSRSTPPQSMTEGVESAAASPTPPDAAVTVSAAEMPPIRESLIVVTGLPRSGTSMLMQMLAAGGMDIFSDGLREADEDNPRGYLEYEPVKNLLNDSSWLFKGRGRVIKIVAHLLAGLPPGLACRVILSQRDLDEVLDSQARMLVNRSQPSAMTRERRRMLKEEYGRTLARVKAMLMRRPGTRLLVVEHSNAISDPVAAAKKVNEFLGGGLDVEKMAAAIDPCPPKKI